MTTEPTIKRASQISQVALKQIFDWMEPLIRAKHMQIVRGAVTVAAGWMFNKDNEGGWGYVQFNDSVDLDALPDPLGAGGTWGASLQDASGDGFLIGSTTDLTVASRGSQTIEAAVALGVACSGDAVWGLGVGTLGGSVTPGKKLTFTDHLGAAILEIHDDGSVHIRTGSSIIADL